MVNFHIHGQESNPRPHVKGPKLLSSSSVRLVYNSIFQSISSFFEWFSKHILSVIVTDNIYEGVLVTTQASKPSLYICTKCFKRKSSDLYSEPLITLLKKKALINYHTTTREACTRWIMNNNNIYSSKTWSLISDNNGSRLGNNAFRRKIKGKFQPYLYFP